MTYDPLILQMIRVIRARPACPVAPADGTGVGSENRTGVICEICGLKEVFYAINRMGGF
jgi:hypothetical protein